MSLIRSLGFLLVGVLIASSAIGCGGGGGDEAGASSGQRAFVGKVNNSDALIGILYDGVNMFVYLTDGKEMTVTYRGPVGVAGAGYFNLRNETGAAIEGRVTGSGYNGTITLGQGSNLSFSAEPAKGTAGIYRAEEGDAVSGWVVLNDGTFKGAKRTGTTVEPVVALGGTKWMDPAAEP